MVGCSYQRHGDQFCDQHQFAPPCGGRSRRAREAHRSARRQLARWVRRYIVREQVGELLPEWVFVRRWPCSRLLSGVRRRSAPAVVTACDADLLRIRCASWDASQTW